MCSNYPDSVSSLVAIVITLLIKNIFDRTSSLDNKFLLALPALQNTAKLVQK